MAPGQTITFYVKRPSDADKHFLIELPRDKIVIHSGTTRQFLTVRPQLVNSTNVIITLANGAPAAYLRVLASIKAVRDDEQISINTRDLDALGRMTVWLACKELQVEPTESWDKIWGTFTWALTHDKMTPTVMQAVWDTFGALRYDPDSRFKDVLVMMAHQYVWDMLHGRFTEEEQKALEATYAPIPILGAMIGDKQDELEPKKKQHDHWKQIDEDRAKGKKGRKSRDRRESGRQARIDRQVEEVINGEREWTEELGPYITAARNAQGA